MLFLLLALDASQRTFFDRLFSEYKAPMWRFARSIVHTPENADDVIQKSFVNLIGKADMLQRLERKSLEAYLFIVVKNTAYNLLKKQQRDSATDPVLLDTLEGGQDDAFFRLLTKMELTAAVDGLAELDRDIIALRYGYDLDFAAIADILNISPVNARVRLHRALAALKRDMAEKGVSYAER